MGDAGSAADLSIYSYSNNDSDVYVQEGTQGDTLTTQDYDAFTGSYYDYVNWAYNTYNTLTISAVTSGHNYFCLREQHDYLNDDPNPGTYLNGCYFANNIGTDKDPKLVIALTKRYSNLKSDVFIRDTCSIELK